MVQKILGSEIKISINVTGIDSCNLSDTEFTAVFYTNRKTQCATLQKSQMVQKDDSTYIAVVDTSLTGEGQIRLELTMYIPDSTCSDGNRTEILRQATDIVVVP